MSLLRMSSGKLVMWIGLLLLSTSCIVPRVQASVGMTDVDDPLLSGEDLHGNVMNEPEEDLDEIGTSRRTAFTRTICTSVREDKNNDGIGEDPVVGALVELCSSAGVRIKSGYTDYTGKCCFSSMDSALYKFRHTTPPGYIPVNYNDGWMNIDSRYGNDVDKCFVIKPPKSPAPTKLPTPWPQTTPRPTGNPTPSPTLRPTS